MSFYVILRLALEEALFDIAGYLERGASEKETYNAVFCDVEDSS